MKSANVTKSFGDILPVDNTTMDIMITLYCWASYAYIILKMKKINVHFRPVTENQDTSNTYVADNVFTVRLEAQKQLKQERQQEIEDRLKVRKEAAKETRRGGTVK